MAKANITETNHADNDQGPNKVLQTPWTGKIVIGELEIPCFVSEDGKRFISGRAITRAIGMKGRGQGVGRITSHPAIKSFISEELRLAIDTPHYLSGSTSRKSNPTAAYEATILHGLCETVLMARDAGALKTEHELRYAYACESLIRAFAKVGIIALIDEATGYQVDRERGELHKLLAVYLSEERLKWAKTFPDEFYKQIYRLKGWKYPTIGSQRTPLIGRITNEVVYEKLPDGVLEKLKQKNPIGQETKRRKWKNFQFLSEDIGQPDLRNHLLQVIALMRAAPDWVWFKRLFARAFPNNSGIQVDLPGVFDETDADEQIESN